VFLLGDRDDRIGPEWLGLVLGGAAIGAVWGAIFGFFAHWATQGQRDFASARGLVAEHYDKGPRSSRTSGATGVCRARRNAGGLAIVLTDRLFRE
jgi:hypothetical protein